MMALDEEDDFLAALPGEEEADVAISDDGEDESDPDVVVELESDEQEQIMRRSLEPRISSGSERRSFDSGSAGPEEIDTTEEAGQVFVMMEETFRVSRNTRAQWFLQYLNKAVVWNPEVKSNLEEKEPLEIISCIPREPSTLVAGESTTSLSKKMYRITQNTEVTFLSKCYRLVFALDITPSMAAVSLTNGNVAIAQLFLALRECLTAISQPSQIPGTTTPFAPKVFVTVFVHAPFLTSKSVPVIVKGFRLLPETLPDLLSIIHDELVHLENDVIPRLNAEVRKYSCAGQGNPSLSKPFVTMDMALSNILRKGLLSVQLLPDNSCGHIIVVTDGILEFPDVALMDSLLSQLRSHTISVSFIRVACSDGDNFAGSDFGYICNVDLMEFIAKTTSGAYVEFKPWDHVVQAEKASSDCPMSAAAGVDNVALPNLGELDGTDASVYRKAFFTCNFQQRNDFIAGTMKRPDTLRCTDATANRSMKRFISHSVLEVSIGGLLSIRLREGFTIKSVNFSKNGSVIDLVLVMPWKPEINLEYRICAVWPPTENTQITAEVHVEAPYEFLYDWIYMNSQKIPYGKHRLATLRQFKTTVLGLESTDQFLLHIEQFRSNPANYTLPEVIKDKMPVFYFPPDDMENPIFSTDELIDFLDFTSFWRPICVMDVNSWHKWLHVHRISILLEHDKPLLNNIFNQRRSATVRCSVAMNQLHDLLRKWSTIVLVDSHSYVRFLFDEEEGPGASPKSFFVIRMAAKPPCVVLRLAFLGGTPGAIRHRIITELDKMVSALTMQVKSLPNVEPSSVLCCWKFAKPVEKMLIQYKDIPSDMFNTAMSPSIVQDKATQTQFPVANPGAFQALSRFLYCRRYVWMPLKQSTPLLYFDAIGRIVTVLVNLRLREGFRFSSTSGGVFNLTMEIQMTDLVSENAKIAPDLERDFPPCVVQFIVFPPKGVRESMGEELVDTDMKLEKYSIAVEIWMEPQYGLCRTAGTPCAYLNNLVYKQVPEKIHELDSDLLSTFLTFETLFVLCSPASSRRPWSYNPSFSRSVSHDPEKHRTNLEDNADMLNFPFDVARLIAKCHRTRMLFPSFRQSDQVKDVTASNAFLFRFFTSEIKRLNAREIALTSADCDKIFELLKEGLTSPQLESLTGSVVVESEVDGEADKPANQAYTHIPEWRLFVKRISEVLLVLTLIPSSYAALQKITETLDIEPIDTDVSQTQTTTVGAVGQSDSSTIFSYGEGDSEADETATLKRPVALAVPVYIFSCTFDGLQAHLVEKKSVSRSHNFDFDLTASFNVQYDRLAKRTSESRTDDFSDRGSLRSSSFPIKNSRDHSKLYLMFPTIEDAFAKAFVQGVYKSLHLGINVDPHDIQAADGLCDEVPVEIDLTAFIRAVCTHFRRDDHHKSKTRSPSKKMTRAFKDDFRLQAPHLDIKQQFQSIVSTCLQRVENKPDLFFYCLPGNLGRSRRSMSDLDLNDSEVSESSVEFRLETSTPIRESVSGLSEAESSPGFFQREVNSISLDSDVESCTSVFGSVVEGESACTDGKEEDDDDEESDDEALTPLFVQFVCAVFATSSKKELGSCPVRQLPTCFEDILKCIDGAAEAARSLDYADIRLRLDVLCLTLPEDLKTISSVEARPSMRTISGSSINRDMRESDSDISTINEEGSARSETEELNQLPPQQAEKMKVVVEKIKWHLQDEIAHVLSSAEELPTTENLTLVVDHVRNSRARQTSVEHRVPLKFVYNVDQSFAMFVQRFEKCTVPGYRFVKQDQYYYLATYVGSPVLRRRAKLLSVPSTTSDRLRSPSFDTVALHSKTSKLSRLAEQKTPRRASLPVFMINKEPHGIVNPVNNADIRAFRRMPAIQDSLTDDEVCMFEPSEGDEMKSSVEKSDHEYDGGSSGSEDEQEEETAEAVAPVEQSQVDRDRAKTELPGFWLILKFSPDEASVFFHVHESEIDSATMTKHLELIEITLRKIKAASKLVNQELLLKNLLETRRCENLLEPETHEDIWKGPAVQEVFAKGVPADGEDDQPGSGTEESYLEASRHLPPGFFKCDMVLEHDFHVHPRLKMGPGKGGMSRASQALLGLLNTFSVSNRQNMFVVQDNAKDAEGAVFYMRLFDKTQCRRFASSSFDGERSRSSSVVRREPDLSRAVTFDAELARLSESPKGDSESRSPSITDSFILSFYGTCPVSDKTATELITALQNRLDEAVLDTLNIILSRNAMIKLSGEDVRFIQPFQALPAATLRISIPQVISKNEISLYKVFHYVLQNLSVFLHCPKYADSETDKHFHQPDPVDDVWRPADDESSFLYNRPSESGGRGIAFISVCLISFAMDTEPVDSERGSWSEKLDLVGNVTELAREEVVEADGDLIFQVWEKGNVDRSALIEKLRHSVRHALLDFWMEEHVLPMLKNMPTSLPPSSCSLLQAYLNCCVDCKSPAYHASTFSLPSRRVVDILADSVVSIVNSPHNSLALSALVSKVDGDVERDSVEVKLDGAQAMLRDVLVPMVRDLKPGHFVSCRVLGLASEEAEVIVRTPRSVSAEAASNDEKMKQRTSKKFMTRFDHAGAAVVPRGKLLYIIIHDTTCQLFLYNFSTDLATVFDKSINRLFEWHHERQRFLNNIVLQKCGVFTPMSVFDSKPSQDMPSFVTNPLQADTLIAYTNAPPREGNRNYQNPKYQHGSLPDFGVTMENSFPSRFFADEQNKKTVDPVVYHGKQFQEIRQRKKRSNEIRYRLNTLYGLWRQRDRRRPISEDVLQLLKNNSRPAHFCASPLLFDPYWRKNLGARFPDRQLLCCSPVQRGLTHDTSGLDVEGNARYDRVDGQVVSTAGNRSRHSSGVPSVTSKDKTRPSSTPNFVGENQRRVSGPSVDQQWHTQVKNILMQEYVHYLQLQGFSVVFARPPSPQRHVKKSPQNNTRATSGTSSPTPPQNVSPQSVPLGAPAAAPRFTPSCTYLQRCVPGGMIFLELFFMEPFFFSRMYAVDLHKFSDDFSAVGGEPDKALMNLQREIDRLKVAMHMHSFLYDFHLNCITKYIAGRSLFFKQGYHFVSFFDDFANYYQKPPSYSKSSFQSGSLVVPCGSIAPNRLYDYILKRDKQYGLSSIRMAAVLPEEDTGTEFALACPGLSSKVREQVDCSFIIYADTTDEIPIVARSSNLILRYYIILTSIDDAYSTDFLEERFGSFKPLPPPKRARPAVPAEQLPVPVSLHTPLMITTAILPPPEEPSKEVSKIEMEESKVEGEKANGESVEDKASLTKSGTSSENLVGKASLVAAFPNFLYIGYFSRLETELKRIVDQQKTVLEDFVIMIVQDAIRDWVRDTLWSRLIETNETENERKRMESGRHREESGTAFGRRAPSEAYRFAPKIQFNEFEDLVKHVYRVPVVDLDPQLSIFFQANAFWLDGLLETLRAKYWDIQRPFVSQQGLPQVTQHLVILCPNLPEITLYLKYKTGSSVIDTDILSKNPINLTELRQHEAFVTFMQGFVNACGFHMWKTVLPP